MGVQAAVNIFAIPAHFVCRVQALVENELLGGLKPKTYRAIEGAELEKFLRALGFTRE